MAAGLPAPAIADSTRQWAGHRSLLRAVPAAAGLALLGTIHDSEASMTVAPLAPFGHPVPRPCSRPLAAGILGGEGLDRPTGPPGMVSLVRRPGRSVGCCSPLWSEGSSEALAGLKHMLGWEALGLC